MRSDAAPSAPLPLAAWALERLAGGDNSPAALLGVPAAAAAREARDDRHPDPVDWPPSQVEGVEAAGGAIPAVEAAGDAIPAAGVVGVASIPAVMGVETIAGPASAAVVHRASGPAGDSFNGSAGGFCGVGLSAWSRLSWSRRNRGNGPSSSYEDGLWGPKRSNSTDVAAPGSCQGGRASLRVGGRGD